MSVFEMLCVGIEPPFLATFILVTSLLFVSCSTTEGLYEAVGEYKAVNQDEISIKQGDTVQVINRSMDGWWEIRYVCYTEHSMKSLYK